MVSFADVSAILTNEFQEPLSDLVNRSNPFLAAVQKKGLVTNQIYMKNENASDHEFAFVPDGATITPGTPGNEYGAATLPWATATAKFKINKRTLAQVASNPGAMGNLFIHEVQSACKDLADGVANAIFAPTASNGIVSIQDAINTGNTYAGINRSTETYWNGLVVEAGTESDPGTSGIDTAGEISTELLYAAERAFYDRTGYDLYSAMVNGVGFLPKALETRYKGLFENIDFGSLATAHFVNQANATGMLGRRAVGFNGMPFLPDRNVQNATTDLASTGRLYLLDMNQVFLANLDYTVDQALKDQQMIDAGTYGEPKDGLRIEIELLANTGEFVSGYVKSYVQFCVPKPPYAGVLIKNISVA